MNEVVDWQRIFGVENAYGIKVFDGYAFNGGF